MKIQWIALVFTLLGETILSLGNIELIVSAYCMFITGNVLWIIYSVRNKLHSITVLNTIFILLGLWGVSNWINA